MHRFILGKRFACVNQNLRTLNTFRVCVSPSKSYTGTLNPDMLIELDDTALDISCRIHAQKSKEGENKIVDTESKGESESENIMADTDTEGEINGKSTTIDFYVDKGSLT